MVRIEEDVKTIVERCKYIPIRLSDEERNLLQILQGALEISEYTDKVDVSSQMYSWYWSSRVSKKTDIIKRELQKMLAFVSGLVVANDLRVGEKLITGNKFEDNDKFFAHVFEIGRRYKIMNPEKMRSTYGKLMYLTQDALTPGNLNFDVQSPIKTVYSFMEEKNTKELLLDEDLPDATRCFIGGSSEENAAEIQKRKVARDKLVEKYSNKLSRSEIQLVLESLSDSNAYIMANRHPIDRMIYFLQHYFDPRREDKYSLSIRSGQGGSCLSHDHAVQYQFVYQSLLLWRDIQHSMFCLWTMADADLLNENYNLTDTGQGLHRLSHAPRVSQVMSRIVGGMKQKVGGRWVGLSVVHLGDRDVPNALVFVDKYTQVPRILTPIVRTIERLNKMNEDPALKDILDYYGGVEHVTRSILQDFFRHGFDGSGDDGGSCIDGRLTSSWNWCSKIEKKAYYPIFMLTGFSGFDGSFRR